ncbi:MAG: hypothetical protein ACREBJ_12495, partial [Nitrosotalea sp.]
DIKTDLERIQRTDSLPDAKEWARFILERLKKRFEPENAGQLENYLTQKTDYLAGNSNQKA